MRAETLLPGFPAGTAATVMCTESLALQQAEAQIKEQQEQFNRQAEQAAKDQAEFNAAVGENEKELEKAKKLIVVAERIRKAQDWAARTLGLGKETTLGRKRTSCGRWPRRRG